MGNVSRERMREPTQRRLRVRNAERRRPSMSAIANPGFELTELLLRVKELEEQQLDLRKSVICAFNQLLDLKDISTGVHSTRLAEWAVRVAREMNIPENLSYQVEVAALLHDIG